MTQPSTLEAMSCHVHVRNPATELGGLPLCNTTINIRVCIPEDNVPLFIWHLPKWDVQLAPFHTMASQECKAPNSNIVWYSAPASSSLPDFPCKSKRLFMRQYLDDHKAFLSLCGHGKNLQTLARSCKRLPFCIMT